MKLLQLLLLAVAGGATLPALAHTALSESVPADHAVLESAPETLALRFSEPVRLTALSIQMDGAAKQAIEPLPTNEAERFDIDAPALADGHYTVSWRALSADAHVVTGEFMFVIGDDAASAGPAHDGHAGAR
jgi:copper transport protein